LVERGGNGKKKRRSPDFVCRFLYATGQKKRDCLRSVKHNKLPGRTCKQGGEDHPSKGWRGALRNVEMSKRQQKEKKRKIKNKGVSGVRKKTLTETIWRKGGKRYHNVEVR